jgi:ligand-binding SRPBCC domain-containing protein
MIEFDVKTTIDRPVAEVYAYVTDPSKLATWQTNTISVESLDPGPLAVGSRLREVHSGPGGREIASVVEVAVLDRDRRFVLKMIDGPLPVDADITFTAAGDGALMNFGVSGRPRGAMRLLQPLLARALRRQFRQHGEELKRVLERPDPIT